MSRSPQPRLVTWTEYMNQQLSVPFAHPQVQKWLPRPKDEERAREELDEQHQNMARSLRFCRVIEVSHVPLGLCSLSRQGVPFGEVDLSFWLAPSHWGQGIASATVACFLQLQKPFPVRRLTSFCLERNERSRRVLEKLGFDLRRTIEADATCFPAHAGAQVRIYRSVVS